MIKVTVEDTETGTVETAVVEDYLLLVAGECHLANRVAQMDGTHVLTVKNATRVPYEVTTSFEPDHGRVR